MFAAFFSSIRFIICHDSVTQTNCPSFIIDSLHLPLGMLYLSHVARSYRFVCSSTVQTGTHEHNACVSLYIYCLRCLTCFILFSYNHICIVWAFLSSNLLHLFIWKIISKFFSWRSKLCSPIHVPNIVLGKLT